MIIKAIKYFNFRNFGNEGKVEFSTDGKISIIYGDNGDGKTTFHQLFRWILYNKVIFNKTTSSKKLYNLKRGSDLPIGCDMKTYGEIEFEHENEQYVVRREYCFTKLQNGSIVHKTDNDRFLVSKEVETGSWKLLEQPEVIIESVLPSGLSDYFLFDGETMIADLKTKGNDSADALKHALYSIFELETYEKALRDIGNKNSTTTVLGKLDAEKLKIAEKVLPVELKGKYMLHIAKYKLDIDKKNELIEKADKTIADNMKRIVFLSEEIGKSSSKKELNKLRVAFVNEKKKKEEDLKAKKKAFGSELANNYSYLLVSKVVEEAKNRIYLQVQDQEKEIIGGLSKELLINLIKGYTNRTCICGNCLGEKEITCLEQWKSMFPPNSYKAIYDKFNKLAYKYSGKYNSDELKNRIISYFETLESISDYELKIKEIDDSLKGVDSIIDDYIDERASKENENKDLEKKKVAWNKEINDAKHQIKIRERKIDQATNGNDEVQQYETWIKTALDIKEAIKERLSSETKDYSHNLEYQIQELVDEMLTSKRVVELNEEFQLIVKDSYNDESKSEGQFAVISFAYIGGILKVLQEHEKLKGKKYPLILDGPFSKMNDVHKQNVINCIPRFAPQIILFSKDPLDEYIDTEILGKVWTIQSNDEKNYAEIKEGFLWN